MISIATSQESTIRQCVENELASPQCEDKNEDVVKAIKDMLLSHIQYCQDGRGM